MRDEKLGGGREPGVGEFLPPGPDDPARPSSRTPGTAGGQEPSRPLVHVTTPPVCLPMFVLPSSLSEMGRQDFSHRTNTGEENPRKNVLKDLEGRARYGMLWGEKPAWRNTT